MKSPVAGLLSLLCFTASCAFGQVRLSVVNDGVVIAAGSSGDFKLAAPQLEVPGQKKESGVLTEVTPVSAVIKYPGGAIIRVACKDGAIIYDFAGMPEAIVKVHSQLKLPSSLRSAGAYAIGNQEAKPFPEENDRQFIASGDVMGSFTLLDAGGAGFTLATETNWYGLQDNRPKGWGDSLVLLFTYDRRAHPGSSQIVIQVTPAPASVAR